MWVTTQEGQLVNLDQAQFIGVQEQKVFAAFDVGRSVVLVEGAPGESLKRLAAALNDGTAHIDLR